MTKALRLETLLVLAGCYLAGCAASPTTAIGADDDRKSSSKSSSKKSDNADDGDDEKADEKDENADDDGDDEADNESDDEASAERDETERPTPTRDAGGASAPAPTTPVPTTPPRTDAGSLFPARVMCTGLADCTQQCAGAGTPCCRTSGTCGCTLGSFCL